MTSDHCLVHINVRKLVSPMRKNFRQSMPSSSLFLLIISIILLTTITDHWSVECAKNRKKVLIIGEIPDESGSLSSPSYSDEGRKRTRIRERDRDGSVFVPVAAYSVTHSRVAGHRDRDRDVSSSVRRSRPGK